MLISKDSFLYKICEPYLNSPVVKMLERKSMLITIILSALLVVIACLYANDISNNVALHIALQNQFTRFLIISFVMLFHFFFSFVLSQWSDEKEK